MNSTMPIIISGRSVRRFAACTAFILAAVLDAAPPETPPGEAKGTFARDGGAAVALTHAAVFVDQKDEARPVILVISDKKLGVEKWTSEFDLMMAGSDLKLTGVVFYLDKEGAVFRCDNLMKGRHESTSGIFTLKLGAKGPKDYSGTASAADKSGEHKLDVTFHAVLKP